MQIIRNELIDIKRELKETNKILLRIAKALEKWNEPTLPTHELPVAYKPYIGDIDCECGEDCPCNMEVDGCDIL